MVVGVGSFLLPEPERASTTRAQTAWMTLMTSIKGNDIFVSFMVDVEMEMDAQHGKREKKEKKNKRDQGQRARTEY